jgi:tetratricopeptide (TPR) repeat protein
MRTQALVAIDSGDLRAGLSLSRRATEQEPDQPESWWVLSMAATQMWLFDEAENALARGAALLPRTALRRADFLCRRARLLISVGRNTVAIQVVRDALTIPDLPAFVLNLLGSTLLHAGLSDEAIGVLTRAVTGDPASADAWFGLGRAREAVGDIAGAETAYQTAIDTRGHTGAHLALARLKRWTADNNHITQLLKAPTRNAGDRSRIAYGLFKEYDDLGRSDEAWAALDTAHTAALSEILPSADGPWGDEGEARATRIADFPHHRETAIVEAWKQHFPVARFASPAPRLQSVMYSGPRRIFIVGLPRSGTTLIERILSAHSQVQPLGELQFMSVAVKRLSRIRGGGLLSPDIVAASAQLNPQCIAHAYDQETAYLSDGSAYTIDKLPQNYLYTGLIRRAFPDAIIIHSRREPMDCLFGIFKIAMGSDYPWIHRQADLAAHYTTYVDLMRHWQACVPDMVDLSLEALINDPQAQIQGLLEACGLPFEAACLAPHETAGPIRTSSSAQVRAPINAQGVGAWRRYAAQLTPLREALYAAGHVDAEGNAV